MSKRNTVKKNSAGKKKAWVCPVIKEIVIEESTQLASCGKTGGTDSPCYACTSPTSS